MHKEFNNGTVTDTKMRTSIAVIKLVLRTNKTLSTGEHPIMLRCSFHGMKEVSTGYSCSVKMWDKKNECVRKGYPNFVMINQHLKKLKDGAIKKRDDYIATGALYSPQMILSPQNENKRLYGDIRQLISQYKRDRSLGVRACEHFDSCYKHFKEYIGRDVMVSEIDEAMVRGFAAYLKDKGLKEMTIRCYLSKIAAISHYAIENGLMKVYPFAKWKYNRIYRETKRDGYIHKRSLLILEELFTNACVEFTKTGFRYKEGIEEKLLDRTSDEYALMLFMSGIVLKGLSPVDVSYLKKTDISVVRIGEKDYWKIDGQRRKTGMPYKLRIDKEDMLAKLCIEFYLMFHTGEYLYPTLDGFVGKWEYKRVNNTYACNHKRLVKWLKKCNEVIIQRNVETNDNIPLIEIDDICYYSYRHTFIMNEIQKPDVNLLRLATITGKSLTTIHQYLKLLDDVDLV